MPSPQPSVEALGHCLALSEMQPTCSSAPEPPTPVAEVPLAAPRAPVPPSELNAPAFTWPLVEPGVPPHPNTTTQTVAHAMQNRTSPAQLRGSDHGRLAERA